MDVGKLLMYSLCPGVSGRNQQAGPEIGLLDKTTEMFSKPPNQGNPSCFLVSVLSIMQIT